MCTGARLVDIAIEKGTMFESDGWKHIESAFESGTVHFIGLASDGGVHSRLNQVSALLAAGSQPKLCIHFETCQLFLNNHFLEMCTFGVVER